MEEVIEVTTATFSMLEKDIMLVVMKADAVVDVPEAKENYEASLQLTKGIRFGALIDARVDATITSEAREYSSGPEQYVNTIAQAVIIASLANRILANFIMQFHKRNKTVEMKVFNDYEAGMTWLKEKIKNDGVTNSPKKDGKKLSLFASI